MDSLSVATPIAGLVRVGAKAINLISTATEASSTARNVLLEAEALQAIFYQLQNFIFDFDDMGDGKLEVNVDQLVTTLTGCVYSFTELEQKLESLKTNHHATAIHGI
ncbi:hypothetical protein BDD12DRAFT_912880 [Trichophaea hybrida]|nr:hypothetical protein BDD12DRAFT_912880 [Trichophaea hybrida]